MRLFKKLLPLTLAVALAACQTTTPPQKDPPTDKTPPTNTTDKTPVDKTPTDTGPKVTPLSDSEFDEAQKSITAAEDMDAARYAPNTLAKAKAAFAQAKSLQATDPTQAKTLLAAAAADAKAATEEAYLAQKTSYLAKVDQSKALVKGIEGDKFRPEAYKAADQMATEAATLFDARDMAKARSKADESVTAFSNLYTPLLADQNRVKALKADTATALKEADKDEAYIWAPDDLEEANKAYFAAADKYRAYDLDSSGELYSKAVTLAKTARAKAKNEKARKESEDLMLETMKKIEEASNLTVVDESDTVIRPQPWKGEKELKTIPTAPKTNDKPQAEGGPQSLRIPEDGTAAVLGEVDSLTFLDKAKELWRKGVAEKNAGNYPVANEYFLEAQRLLKAWQAMAVDKLYTVRLIPERRDALWRIAEYSQIYGDPLLWPKIWKRNKKQIQNPDLIFPGWELVIPPK